MINVQASIRNHYFVVEFTLSDTVKYLLCKNHDAYVVTFLFTGTGNRTNRAYAFCITIMTISLAYILLMCVENH